MFQFSTIIFLLTEAFLSENLIQLLITTYPQLLIHSPLVYL